MIYKPYPYQEHAEEHILNNPSCGLFLEMGLGKTTITLSAIQRLMFEELEVNKTLVIAPKRVAEDTWSTEASKWEHLKGLKLSLVIGSESERVRALRVKADIYIISRDNVAWLVSLYGLAFPFDMVVIDELSSFKSSKAIRFRALRSIRPLIKRIVGLTGTPAPNSLLDLWAQIYLLDKGERLGDKIGGYRERYFKPDARQGAFVHSYKLRDERAKNIYKKIGDICISMKSEDYLALPQRIDRIVPIKLSGKVMSQYNEFERKQVLALEEINDITAVNAAVLSNKLLQFANGAIYDDTKVYHSIHEAKLEALEEIIEVSNGQPILVFYSFKHDLERMQQYLKAYKPVVLKSSKEIKDWNDQKISVLLAHPASAGHGLNLQAGGNTIIWFGLTWSLELYQQANARLHRQGQTKPVIVHHLVASGTMDEDVLKSIEGKATGQNALMDAVKARIKKYKKLINAA